MEVQTTLAMGKAKSFEFGRASTGTEQIGVAIEIQSEGPYKGVVIPWYGFLNSDENTQRSLDSLIALGWDGKDPVKLTGLGSKAAQVTIEQDEWEGVSRIRIAWVNVPGVPMKDRMDDDEKSALGKRLAKFMGKK